MSEETAEHRRQRRQGKVVSDRMDKTIVVMVSTKKRHPRYRKFVTRRVKYKAHDENNECRIDDTVEIEETKPLSKEKRWKLVRIVERAPQL
jgi:30S ribosomal protein S17